MKPIPPSPRRQRQRGGIAIALIFVVGFLILGALATSLELQLHETRSPDADPRVPLADKVAGAVRRHMTQRSIVDAGVEPSAESILRNANLIAGLDVNYVAVAVPPRDERLGVTTMGFAPTTQAGLCRGLTVVVWVKANAGDEDPEFRYLSTLAPTAETITTSKVGGGDVVWRVVPLRAEYDALCDRMHAHVRDIERAFERRARAKIDSDPLRDASVNYLYGEPSSAESLSGIFATYQRPTTTAFVSFTTMNVASGYRLTDMLALPRTTGILRTMYSDAEDPAAATATSPVDYSICIALPSTTATASAIPPFRLDIYWTPSWISSSCAGPTNGAFAVAAIQSIQ